MGSADWMPRNLDKRVEILFPVEDSTLKEEVIHILDIQLKDNMKARELQPDGTYHRLRKGRMVERICAQDYFKKAALEVSASRKKKASDKRTFEPMLPPSLDDSNNNTL